MIFYVKILWYSMCFRCLVMVRNTSDGEEVASDENTLEEAVEKQNWVNLVNEEVPFTCLVKVREKKYPYRPFKLWSFLK